ncbi:spore germination protein [Paenibacillus mesophilus]|uniref:spore germination protein n=1 Tax=Paenibacillus mesophilus TaxID=2582849 RepID=UPI00110EE889|nr:spore germination protein [Paenibacillus mesophilus]TMV46977.1 spore germination protein [Paenibacillus mesophilus]
MGIFQKIFSRKRKTVKDKPETYEAKEQLHSDIGANFSVVKKAFGNSKDVIMGEIILDPSSLFKVGFIYMEGMADTANIQEKIKQPLLMRSKDILQQLNMPLLDHFEMIKNHIPAIGETKPIHDFSALYKSILSGETVILVEGYTYGFAANTTGGYKRAVEEPTTQSVVRGPREGFTETLDTNISLIRKRIKTPNLWLETLVIGEVTQTNVGIMFINGIVNDKIVEEVRIRLARIEIDGILESGNIEELIQDETFTPFPTLYNSERPDVIAAGLLEGRIAILVDGTPFVLLAPALFAQFYQSAEDYYQRAEFATLIRILRYACFFISLLAPSLYIAVTTFHQELLPSSLLFSLAAQREGIPFPAFVEALIMEITFEILREAGVRLPKTVGQAVSIVGALVIGQAAVEAGLVSPAMVIVVAITAISNFVIPSFNMGISIRILRFILMIFAATFGLFGVTVGLIATVQHLCSLRSFGVPYMSPMAPFNLADQKDTILRLPQWALFSRPRFISKKNRIREDNAPTTKPERKGK